MLTQRKKLRLLDALLESYPGEHISGYLLDVRISCGCVQGEIYNSLIFRDGQLVTSGEIIEVVDYGNRFVIKTYWHEAYVVVNFHTHGGRQSLKHLIGMFQSAQLARAHSRLQ